MRTLVIGDIHGGLRALTQLLEHAKVTPKDQLIFLGDYVDGWSESAQLIDFLIDLEKKYNCIFIKGNHDAWCEDYLRTNKPNKEWLKHGGDTTIESYRNYSKEELSDHLKFFERTKMFHHDDKNRLFIHAGFTSMHGPENEVYSTNYNWDRTLWELALATNLRLNRESLHYPRRLKLFKEIYIGHTPTINYCKSIPMNAVNVWNIDTGAAFTGMLTMMDIDTKEYWQSKPLSFLYPDENGRNDIE